MSNVLIIKHGSLGDLIQANGAIKDIKNNYKDSKVLLLTSKPYLDLMTNCPYIDGVIVDKRLPRWNIFYLLDLRKLLLRYKFTHIFDLQNSSRTRFYKKFLLNNSIWSSTETALGSGEKKSDFDQEPVLERMQIQLNKSGVKTNNINKVDLTWAFSNINRLVKQYTNNEYILIFPFCSKKHKNKKWPYFKILVEKLKEFYKNKYSILVIPGPGEITEAQSLNAKVVLDGINPVSLNILISFINRSKFIISNDTGPAHISSHLDKKGLVLFGSHTTSKKVSIGSRNFKPVSVNQLSELEVNTVLDKIKNSLD